MQTIDNANLIRGLKMLSKVETPDDLIHIWRMFGTYLGNSTTVEQTPKMWYDFDA